MKINFKQPRYVLPLILLPFLCLFFYGWKISLGKDKKAQSGGDFLQESMADVSPEVKKKALADKLDAYRDQYKNADGYTAVGGIADEQLIQAQVPNLYNVQEKRMLDSIDQAMKRKYGAAPAFSEHTYSGQTASGSKIYDSRASVSDRDLAEALNKLKEHGSQERLSQVTSASETDPMKVFRQQMSLIDSMGKANDPEYKAEQEEQQAIAREEKQQKEQKKLRVSKTLEAAALFNTVSAEKEESFIRAMIDQDITGYAGSRLRIRLLDDMAAGKFMIKRGTYLYALISGFSGQRVNLVISSIFQDNHILPVKLEVYDNDGIPGLYVPASAFREFSRELGSNGAQGLTLQQQAENNSQLVMSMMQKMFQSTSSAVSKLIRQNKTRLKYNTMIYLIDPDELKNKQSNY